MPRAPRSKNEVALEKKKIINVAMRLIYHDGFEHLSMRKIASKLGMTAANIYNYFSNKDELYIEMRRHAFEGLYERLYAAYKKGPGIEERIKNIIEEYVSYGLEERYAYELMFVLKLPNYDHYKDTPLEEIARRETESALRVFELIVRCVREFSEAGNKLPADESTCAIILWTHLHGAISLNNNALLSAVAENPSMVIETIVNLQYSLIFNVLQNPLMGDLGIE